MSLRQGTTRTYRLCRAADKEELAEHGYVLTPGRYVEGVGVESDGEPFETKMSRLIGQLEEQFVESDALTGRIRASLGALGYER